MRKRRIAWKIITTLTKDQWHYRGRLIVDLFLIFIRCGVLLVLYAYVFRLKNGVINDATFAIVAWSIFFYFAFITLRLREITRMIMHDVAIGCGYQFFCDREHRGWIDFVSYGWCAIDDDKSHISFDIHGHVSWGCNIDVVDLYNRWFCSFLDRRCGSDLLVGG